MRSWNGLVLASLNAAKQAEFAALFEKHKIPLSALESHVRNPALLSGVESLAAAASYEENAQRKCQAVYRACKLPCFADDSGIEVDALAGRPGVQSAHFGKPSARESQDVANRRALLDAMKGKGDRRARMRCVLVFQLEGLRLVAEGVCEGRILEQEKGGGGFGYDPVFAPDAAGGRSFAELTQEEKNQLSHRALAVAELARLLREREVQLVRP